MTTLENMIRAIVAVLLLNFASHAAAQESDSPYFAPAFSQLPADLKSYLSAVATNTAIAAAIVGDYVTEPDVLSDGSRGAAYSQAIPFIQGAQSRFLQAATATAVPDDQKTILASIARVISADAATDGLFGSGPTSTAGQMSTATATTTHTSNSAGSTMSSVVTTASASSGTVSGTPSPSKSTSQAGPTPTSNGASSITFGMLPVLFGLQLLAVRVFAIFV